MRFRSSIPLLALLLLIAACADQPLPTMTLDPDPDAQALLGLGGAPLDDALTAALADAGPGDVLEVIIDVDGPVANASALAGTLAGLGAGVVGFEHLSVLGAIATPDVIAAARLLPGVAKIHLNRELDYLLAGGIASIGADAVHAAGITGAGVGIAIMDSGIDGAANPDVAYPGRTVQT